MNSMKDGPPHVDASVGPTADVNGQLQLIWKSLIIFENVEGVLMTF